MINAASALVESELPLLEVYIGSSTGLLTITVDKDESTELESGIRGLIGEDIPIELMSNPSHLAGLGHKIRKIRLNANYAECVAN